MIAQITFDCDELAQREREKERGREGDREREREREGGRERESGRERERKSLKHTRKDHK